MGGASKNWFQELLAPLLHQKPSTADQQLGQVWSGNDAEQAFAKGAMNSQDAGKKLRVGFRNQSKLPLILSWVAENGKCHHFYKLQPAEVLLEGPVTALDHVENTNCGHAFCIAYAGDDEDGIRKQDIPMDPKYIVGGYRPTNILRDGVEEGSKSYAHLVTISQKPAKKRLLRCCQPPNLRGSSEIGNELDDDMCWVVEATESFVDDTQINTADKYYEETTLGGWPVRLEPDWHGGNKDLEKLLAEDLEFAAKCLPPHARDFLRKNTPVYVNKSLQYGPEVCPINGRGLCFHPEKDWLEEMFMSPDKCECVELYHANEYLSDSKLWGRAGVLVHEFSHAYHHKCCEDGYQNKEILKCYEQAMKDKLYDWVRVHGPQGPMAKAYACNNCMEYFAELSAAFLGGKDMHTEEEFNKWYPFNRRQIKEHDPRAYELLKKIWKV